MFISWHLLKAQIRVFVLFLKENLAFSGEKLQHPEYLEEVSAVGSARFLESSSFIEVIT